MEDGRPEVYLVRHGATDWSVSGRHTGRTDLPLNDTGRGQADGVAHLLAGRPFALVLVSPLRRAQETCAAAGYLDRAVTTTDLREWDYGDYEGLTTAEIRQRVPGWTVWTGPIPGGERLEDVAERARRVIDRALGAGGDVALFAHGHILRVLAACWCELPPREGRRFPLETATLSVLGWEHEHRGVRLWNRPSSRKT
ncbi:histidine phosphatase family protein [Rhabdothermincola sediminis]|uniref:histidine phosphatase family protein n=1 Tax=Rhabdothermincola sediminis TaxID=2751370 RepID=UPI001AA0982E|nr:histidine phosphatase family protein [Rhabdothermincola sediminis]